MAYLDQPINAADLPEGNTGDFSPIPPGDYNVTIKSAELKNNNKGTGQYINLRLDVTGPTHSGRVIFSMVNIRNESGQAEAIGRAQLGAIMKAVGLATLQDTDELIGGSLVVKVAIREARTDEKTGKTYEAQNEVKAYKVAEGAMPSDALGYAQARSLCAGQICSALGQALSSAQKNPGARAGEVGATTKKHKGAQTLCLLLGKKSIA